MTLKPGTLWTLEMVLMAALDVSVVLEQRRLHDGWAGRHAAELDAWEACAKECISILADDARRQIDGATFKAGMRAWRIRQGKQVSARETQEGVNP